jgi:DNA-binding winged helix-turn-helix (wHTH) protein
LLCESRPVPLGSRAFDLLEVLLRHRGAVVSKEQIVRSVWPSTTVEESNLRFQMAALRKALGSDRDLIKTIPGRGYVLAAEAEVEPGSGRVLGFQTAPVAPPSGQAELAIGSIARPEYAFLRRIEDCERRRLETLSAALLCCLEELRQISGKAARRRVVTYARARPDLRAQNRSKRNRAHR